MQNQQDKNPNSGYLPKNAYGLFGKIPVTPQLLQEIQKNGFVAVSVGDTRQHSNASGSWESAYCALKPYTPKDTAPQGGYNQSQGAYTQAPAQQPQGYTQAPPQFGGNHPQAQQPMQQQTQQGFGAPTPDLNDDVPF